MTDAPSTDPRPACRFCHRDDMFITAELDVSTSYAVLCTWCWSHGPIAATPEDAVAAYFGKPYERAYGDPNDKTKLATDDPAQA